MKVAIIVAMDKELQLLLPLLGDDRLVVADGYELHCGRIGAHEVCLMKCGIGKVNAALGCRAMMQAFNPGLVINSGVAGGTGGRAGVLDVVAATAVGYHDVWCGPGTLPGQAAGCPRVFPGAAEVLSLPVLKENPDVRFGTVASGDVFVDSRATVDHVLRLYPDAVGVDMESGAVAQTCFRMGVPFVCLRVISDTPGEVADNGAQYESFWTAAPQKTFAILRSILDQL